MEIVSQVILAFLATICFSTMFNVPKKELVFCGIAGGIGWFFYHTLTMFGFSSISSNFFGAFFIAYFSRLFSKIRRCPASVFLTSGILTLVPGSSLYKTALNIIMENNASAMSYGLETIKIACSIAFGIVAVLWLPKSMFRIKSK